MSGRGISLGMGRKAGRSEDILSCLVLILSLGRAFVYMHTGVRDGGFTVLLLYHDHVYSSILHDYE